MAWVTYIEFDGTEYKVDVPIGDSVMQGAINNGITGIVAECGGGLACATCHCMIDEAWTDRVGGPSSDAEAEMIEAAANNPQPNSRLSCQVTVDEDLDGLIVRLPESQY